MKKLLCYSVLCVVLVITASGVYHSLIAPLITFSDAAGWVSTPVTIEKVELHQERSGSSTSHYLTIQYSYEWDGVRYSSDRIDIYPNSLGKSLQRKRSLFTQYRDQHTDLAFVDPDAPQVSLLQRRIHLGDYLYVAFKQLLFVYFCFGACWLLLALASADDDYDDHVVEDATAYESPAWKYVAYFAGMFSLISIGIVAVMVTGVRNGSPSVLFFTVFPLASLFLWWAVWYFWSNRFDQHKLQRGASAGTAN